MTSDTDSTDNDLTLRRRPLSRPAVAIVVGLLVIVACGIVWRSAHPDSDRWLTRAHRAFAAGEVSRALALAEQALQQRPDSTPALRLAGDICVKLDRIDDAVAYYDRITHDDQAVLRARRAAGELLLNRQKKLTAAETRFRQVLELAPDDLTAHAGMAYILGLCSRVQEAVPHRLQLLRAGRTDVTELYVLAAGDAAILNPEVMNEHAQAVPDDPLPKLALARVAFKLKDYSRAVGLLKEVLKTRPELSEAQARLGESLFAMNADDEFIAWNAQLPVAAEDHPRIWHVRAEWAERQGDRQGAIRCEWEAVRRDPNDAAALYQLGQYLAASGESETAHHFLARAGQLADYIQAAELAMRGGGERDFRRAVSLAESLGLIWEASGWAVLGNRALPSSTTWSQPAAARLQQELASLPLTRCRPDVEPAASIDGTAYALPTLTFPSPTPEAPPLVGSPGSEVTFRDDAIALGLNFRYHNGGDPLNRGLIHMYEIVGGGIGVIDFDLDGWPDVFLTQGSRWPPDPSNAASEDQLFRNQSGEHFADVTTLSHLISRGFGQGVTVGDFNGDGFADLFVGNIGPNRLLENNGDGTFSDVTLQTGVASDAYTTSTLMADLNGDALPDLYAANYLAGDDLFTRVCGDERKQRSCLPQVFDAAPDRLDMNLGDGRFTDATEAAGLAVPQPGKSLGIVAADLEGSGRLSLYLANDVGPNFLFINQTGQPGGVPSFVESGLLAGVALNVGGSYESGMGIAAGDVDQNGLLDLFVTNFDNETNTLYLQNSDAMFLDQTRHAGLDHKRDDWVGWGAQFLDGELDGWPDLLLTNGHVNDVRDHGTPFRMPTQYFRNLGGTFSECDAEQLGPFFEQQALGRAVARIDWNRDGLEDVLIGHLDAPTALLTNTTTTHGHFLACRLIAVESAREAIGTSVIVRCGDEEWTRQLTAGDGMQSSNQRLLVFGLGDSRTIDEIEIRWPSGTVDHFYDLPCNQQFTFVEGRRTALPSPR